MKDITPLRPPRAAHAEPPAHAPNAALLIDFDNVTLAIRSDLSSQLRKLLSSDIFKGKVSVQRAYADWRRYPQYIVPLSEASIDLIFAPAFGSNKKNATDIRLAIDALELVFSRPEIGTFILLSGDSDFSSLVVKLKEYGKFVIGVGIRESSSDLLVQNCDEYYSYSELTGLTKQTDVEYARRDPWELVIAAVTQMTAQGDVMRSDRLKQVMQSLDPSFDEKNAGFSRFSKFVTEAGQRGLLKVTKLNNGQYEIDLGSNANVPPAVEADLGKREPAPAPRQQAPRSRERAGGGTGTLSLAAAFHLLRDTLVELGALAAPVEAEVLRERMMERSHAERDPVFEKARFQRLLRQAHDANLVELTKNEDDRYFLKLSAEALVEDRAGQPALAEAGESGNGGDTDAGRRRRRGRRGGRGRGQGGGGGHRGETEREAVEESHPPLHLPVPSLVAPTPHPAAAAAPESGVPARRNPRFRRGSRGPLGPAAATGGPVGGAPDAPLTLPPVPPAPPAPSTSRSPLAESGSHNRSLRPRHGSRGGGPRAQPSAGSELGGGAAPPVGEPERGPRVVRREPEAAAPPPAPPESPTAADSVDEAPSLLKRMTAALKRAARGTDQEKH